MTRYKAQAKHKFMPEIKKAVITTAGFGTRFLPISKTIQKEMLPILNRPLVDYVVEDLLGAGVEEIIFVISEHNMQVLHFYRENPRLYNYLEKMGKGEMYAQVEHLHSKAKFTFVRQPDDMLYGTAIPVKLCREHLENEEAFFVFMGDDFLYNGDGKSEAAQMKNLIDESGASALATFIEKPREEVFRYGVAEVREANGQKFLTRLVEKPEPGQEPSNLVNISKYVLTPDIFDIMEQQQPDKKTGELYITDTVEQLAQQKDVVIYTPQGEWLDGGNVAGWLHANLRVAQDNPELKSVVKNAVIK